MGLVAGPREQEGGASFPRTPAQPLFGLDDGVPQTVSLMDGMSGRRTGTNGGYHQGIAWEVLQDSGPGTWNPGVCELTATVLA